MNRISTAGMSVLGLVLLNSIGFASVPSFTSTDLLSHQKVSFPSASAKATAIVFISAKCPCSASHEEVLKNLYRKFSPQGIEFVAVHSNQDEAADLARTHFAQAALPFPVIEDSNAKIADQLKALKTPHAFIFQHGELVYQGGVDDSASAASAQKHFLDDALTAITEGKPVPLHYARALGCIIKR